MKTYLLGLILALAAPVAAFAAVSQVSIVSVALDPSDAQPGQQVTLTVVADKTSVSGGCTNNWGYTKIFLDGNQIGTSTVDSFAGTGTTSDQFVFNAPTYEGSFDILVEVWSGAEDFAPADSTPDCADELLDDATVELDVAATDTSSSQKKAYTGPTGGGGICHPKTGYPECMQPANYAFYGLTPGAEVKQAMEIALLNQLVAALQKWVALLQ